MTCLGGRNITGISTASTNQRSFSVKRIVSINFLKIEV